MPGKVAVLIRDLIFETKIKSTGASLGVAAIIVRNAQELNALLEKQGVRLLIVDLNSGEAAAMEAIRLAKSHGVRVLAFASHVDADLAAKAGEAGADEVMPRSRFSLQLPALLMPQPESPRPAPDA